MKREEIELLLNAAGDPEIDFHIKAAIEHIQSKTNRRFEVGGVLDLPTDLVQAVRLLVESQDESSNLASESVGGELSVTYFNRDAIEASEKYWMPYRKLAW